MSEYDELVKRLRSAARAQAAGGGWTDHCAVENTIDWNAADAIEALVKRTEKAEAEVDRLRAVALLRKALEAKP